MKRTLACGFALIVGLSAPLVAAPVYIPVIDAQGADGKALATQLWISNFDGVERQYSSVFLKSETDGTGLSGRGDRGVVPADRAVYLKRLAGEGETGLLEIDGDELAVNAWIQTTRGRRTFYAGVPQISEENRIAAGGSAYLNGVGRLGDRDVTQLALVNLGTAPSQCLVDVVDAAGSFQRAAGAVEVPALSMSRFEDALGLRGEAAVSAKVSCDQPFYAFAVTVDGKTSEVGFLNPSESVEKAKTPARASGNAIVFTQAGRFHTATKAKPKSILRVPVPRTIQAVSVRTEFDFVAGPWNSRMPGGAHNLLFFHRGRFRGNTLANLNAQGPGRNFLKMNQNIDLPAKHNTKAQVGQTLERGKKYHAVINYDAANQVITVVFSRDGAELKRMALPATARNRVLEIPVGGLVAEFGNYNNQELPEVSSLGWSFENFRVTLQPK